MPTYKLEYFAGKGVAERTRFVFAVGKQDYEDFRFPLTFGVPGDFSTMSRPEFDAAKVAGGLDASCGKVPLLTVDGTFKLGQSKAIERYLAKQFGLMGSSPTEEAQVDCCIEHEIDWKGAYGKLDKKDDAVMDKWWKTDFPAMLGAMDKALAPAPGPWMVGSKVSLADIAMFVSFTDFFTAVDKAAKSLEAAPKLKAAVEAVGKIPEVVAWIAKRPQTPF